METGEEHKNDLWQAFEACASVENYLKYKGITQQQVQEENKNANYHNGDCFKRS